MLPTPMCELLLDLDWSAVDGGPLRHILTGGDRLRRSAPPGLPFRVTNTYGPAEAAVVSTWAPVPVGDDALPPPIGRPVSGTWARILDADGRPLPVGAAGELCVGGAQLAAGYLNSPEETARRFVEHPEYGSMLRTGDVARWRGDGQLEFLHRDDHQVQIRGQRVEPGETEHHLRRLEGIQDAAVRAWQNPDGETYLAGYVVTGLDVDELRTLLRAQLPDYLIPTAWTVLPELPLNNSGKLDRGALPEPAGPAVLSSGQRPPATELERQLHDVWCAVLGLDSVSAEANFFELGGHSLMAVQLLSKVRAELGRTLGVLEFFRAPTIAAMAERISAAPAEEALADDAGARVRGTL